MAGDRALAKSKHGGGRPGAGRPRWEPAPQPREISPGVWRPETADEAWESARQKVRHFAAIGYPQDVICRLVEPPMRCADTLRTYFAFELENGRLIADAKMAGTAYYLGVTGRDPAMCRFWLRARCGWRDVGDVKTPTTPIQFQLIEGDDW
jgi:hypothetical protein